MSPAKHEAMALHEEQNAQAHAAQYDPVARAVRGSCGRAAEVCWTSTVNPTAAHRREADEHRQLAARHRAASQALRDAEVRACAGVGELDRDMSPFAHREEIARVEPLSTLAAIPKSLPRTRGAAVYFRATPGLTAQWLQRVVDCHIARNAALGHEVPEMPYCPLVPKGVAARVLATGSEFAIEITSDDPVVAQEILRRARALVTR